MPDYKRLKEDINGLVVIARLYKEDLTDNENFTDREIISLYNAKRVILKDILIEGSQLGRSIFEVLYNCERWDYENKLQFYKGLLEIAERGKLKDL